MFFRRLAAAVACCALVASTLGCGTDPEPPGRGQSLAESLDEVETRARHGMETGARTERALERARLAETAGKLRRSRDRLAAALEELRRQREAIPERQPVGDARRGHLLRALEAATGAILAYDADLAEAEGKLAERLRRGGPSPDGR